MTIKTITQNNKQLPKKKEVNPKFSLRVKDLLKILKSNSEVLFQPLQPFYCESFDTCKGLGRVAVIDSNQLVMLGKTIEVEYKD